MPDEYAYRPDVRVRLVGEEPFFGPGTVTLLRHIQRHGSVAAACERMRLSYSKGRAMLRRMERELGYPVVLRSKGGSGGGGNATITQEGARLLEQYTHYEARVRQYAQQEFSMLLPALYPHTEEVHLCD